MLRLQAKSAGISHTESSTPCFASTLSFSSRRVTDLFPALQELAHQVPPIAQLALLALAQAHRLNVLQPPSHCLEVRRRSQLPVKLRR